jgi:hypothetical protein
MEWLLGLGFGLFVMAIFGAWVGTQKRRSAGDRSCRSHAIVGRLTIRRNRRTDSHDPSKDPTKRHSRIAAPLHSLA